MNRKNKLTRHPDRAALAHFEAHVESAGVMELRQIAAAMRRYRFRQAENRALDRLCALTGKPRIWLRQQAIADVRMGGQA